MAGGSYEEYRPAIVERSEVWNLAIGSNMDESKLRRRNLDDGSPIQPLQAGVPAVVDGWMLSFDYRFIPPLESVMAAAVPREGQQLHGVLYKLSREDYERLCESEGCTCASSLYKEVAVEASVYQAARTNDTIPEKVQCIVFALRNEPRIPERLRYLFPSKRYLSMLVRGSTTAGLDADYIRALENHPTNTQQGSKSFERYCWLATAGTFYIYRFRQAQLVLRRFYLPPLFTLVSRAERATAEQRQRASFLWNLLAQLYIAPSFALGFSLLKLGSPFIKTLLNSV